MMIAGVVLLILTIFGFPFWMILVAFRFGDRIQNETGSSDKGALAAVVVGVFPPLWLVAIGVSMLMRGIP